MIQILIYQSSPKPQKGKGRAQHIILEVLTFKLKFTSQRPREAHFVGLVPFDYIALDRCCEQDAEAHRIHLLLTVKQQAIHIRSNYTRDNHTYTQQNFTWFDNHASIHESGTHILTSYLLELT